MGRKPECFAGNFFGNTLHFVKHSTGLNNTHPGIRGSFTFTHPGFSRFAVNGLSWKDTNPYFTTPLDIAGHGNTGSFNLTRIKPAAFGRLQTIFAKSQRNTSSGVPHIRPFICFLYLTFLGINIAKKLLYLLFTRKHFTFENKNLDADNTVSRFCLGKTIIYICP